MNAWFWSTATLMATLPSIDAPGFRRGDPRAFEALYKTHVATLNALALRLTGQDHDLAAELIQDSFIRAWHQRSQFRGDASFATWMHRIVVNAYLATRRRSARLVAIDEASEPAVESAALAIDAASDLEQALARLPERARLVVVLHELEGYSHDEIAALTGMAAGTSRAHLHRGRDLLKRWAARHGGNP